MPVRGPRREGGLVHQHAAARAVARQGARAARRRALGAALRLPPDPPREGALRRLDGASATGRSATCTWDYPVARPARGAERRGGAEGDQRLRRRHRPPGRLLLRPARRRLDGVAAAGSTPASTPTASTRRSGATRATSTHPATSHPSGAGRGRPTAASSTTAPPPTRRASRGRSARSTSGGTGERLDGLRRPGLPARQAAGLRRARTTPRAWTAISGTDPFIMMGDGRGWLYTPTGLLDGPLPTHYEPIESPVANALYPDVGANPAAITWQRPENPFNPMEQREVPGDRVHVPAHRAPHDRADEPQPAVARRAAARALRRDRPGAGRRPRDRGRRLDGDLRPSAARSRRGRRSRGASGRCGSAARSCTRSRCRGTGAATRPPSRASRATRSTT